MLKSFRRSFITFCLRMYGENEDIANVMKTVYFLLVNFAWTILVYWQENIYECLIPNCRLYSCKNNEHTDPKKLKIRVHFIFLPYRGNVRVFIWPVFFDVIFERNGKLQLKLEWEFHKNCSFLKKKKTKENKSKLFNVYNAYVSLILYVLFL